MMVMIMSTVMLPTFICVAVSRVTITGTFLLRTDIVVIAVFAYLHCMLRFSGTMACHFDIIFFALLRGMMLSPCATPESPLYLQEKREGEGWRKNLKAITAAK